MAIDQGIKNMFGDPDRVKALENAIIAIWRGHCIAVSNGGGSYHRHVDPAIYEAIKLIPKEYREAFPEPEPEAPDPPWFSDDIDGV